jgi:hypothetical protein
MSLSAPDSEVDICNLALDLLKQDAITQIDPPNSVTEAICARHYHQVRRRTLRAHVWNFAAARKQISPDGTAPLFEYTHAYDLPNDFIRYVGRYDELGTLISEEEYDLEQNQLLLNGEDNTAINIKYIKDATEVVKFDPLFIDLFVVNLAIRIAPKFTAGEKRLATLAEMQKEIKAEATAIDGQERPPRRVQRSKWVSARRLGRRNVAGPLTRFD